MPPDIPGSALRWDGRAGTCSACEPAGTLTARVEEDVGIALPCYCRIDGLFDVIGKKYAVSILGLLWAQGSLRYSEIEEELEITSTSTLATRLDDLAATSLIDRQRYKEIPPRVEYTLTPQGHELIHRLQPLLEWLATTDA